MEELRFDRDEDFSTRLHQDYREDGWMGGPHTEVMYLLSCLTRTNYRRTPFDVWNRAAQEFISAKLPSARWTTYSTYFATFAVLMLKDLYRQSKLGKKYAVREEHREERVTRFGVTNPELTLETTADRLKTTVKQLQRNSTFMLARREYERTKSLTTNT